MRALGGSMWPTIPHGTTLELSLPDRDHPPEPGTVVAVVTERGQLLIHRVVGLKPDGTFLLKGDNCPAPDGWFPQEAPLAVATRMHVGGAWREIPRTKAPIPPLPHRALAKLHRLKTRLVRPSHARPRPH